MIEGLKYNTTLLFLNLSRNCITDTGAEMIGAFLARNEVLRVLFLHWNPIGNKGSLHLSKSLLYNEHLQVLDLSFCRLGMNHKKPKDTLEQKRDTSAKKGTKKSSKKEKEKKEKKGKSKKQKKVEASPSPERKLLTQSQFNNTLSNLMEHNYNRPCKRHKIDTSQAQSWARTFETNKTLLHLDFSHNNMDR